VSRTCDSQSPFQNGFPVPNSLKYAIIRATKNMLNIRLFTEGPNVLLYVPTTQAASIVARHDNEALSR
jgi:hypothetical protein